MMCFWNRKESPPKAPHERERITFRSDDDMETRANNLWAAMGFVNDRHDMTGTLRLWLKQYHEWDTKMREADAVKHRAAHYDTTTGAFTWNDEAPKP